MNERDIFIMIGLVILGVSIAYAGYTIAQSVSNAQIKITA